MFANLRKDELKRKRHLDYIEAPLLLCVVVYTKKIDCQEKIKIYLSKISRKKFQDALFTNLKK